VLHLFTIDHERIYGQAVSYQDFLTGLVREALGVREQRRRERRLSACHLPFVKRLEEFEWEAQPTLNRAEVERLFTLHFIDVHDNAAFLGAPGLGKTMLAVALGVAAVEAGYTVRFAQLDEWSADAQAAEAAGSLASFLRWRGRQPARCACWSSSVCLKTRGPVTAGGRLRRRRWPAEFHVEGSRGLLEPGA